MTDSLTPPFFLFPFPSLFLSLTLRHETCAEHHPFLGTGHMGRRDGSDYYSSQGTWSSVCCRGRCVSSPDRKLLWLSLALVVGLNGHFIRVFAALPLHRTAPAPLP